MYDKHTQGVEWLRYAEGKLDCYECVFIITSCGLISISLFAGPYSKEIFMPERIVEECFSTIRVCPSACKE